MAASGTAIEIEAKWHLLHLASIRQRLISAGARLLAARQLERNARFDTPDGRLSRAGEVLRLREEAHHRLTYKRPLAVPEGRTEIELEIDDPQAAAALLHALGYQAVFVYEKYRETFGLEPALVMLDELPFGCFVEIEAPSLPDVALAATRVGLGWERRITRSYVDLFEELRRRQALPFRNATFAEFAGRPPAPPQDLGLGESLPTD